jgi:hypothetical protein
LTSLPEGMPCLTLEIIGCPFLDEECSTNRWNLAQNLSCPKDNLIISSLERYP